MDAGCGPECIAAKYRIIQRNWPAAGIGGDIAILFQTGEVPIQPPQQFQIHKQLVHRGISDAFSDAERGTVNLVSPALDCGN